MSYQKTPTLPTQGNAASCKCGNAREHYHTGGVTREGFRHVRREGYKGGRNMMGNGMMVGNGASYNGVAGGSMHSQSCHFPMRAPQRVYCQPAPFSQSNGQVYQPIAVAYGRSVPMY